MTNDTKAIMYTIWAAAYFMLAVCFFFWRYDLIGSFFLAASLLKVLLARLEIEKRDE